MMKQGTRDEQKRRTRGFFFSLPFPFRLAHSYPPPASLFHCLEKNSRTSRDKETRDKDEGKEKKER